MKFVCSECKKLVDEKDTVCIPQGWVWGFFHLKCWEDKEKEFQNATQSSLLKQSSKKVK